MKIVSMSTINNVFSCVEFVDYVSVEKVTDSALDLQVHLKTSKKIDPETQDWQRIKDCSVVLGKILDRSVSFSIYPASILASCVNYLKQKISKST